MARLGLALRAGERVPAPRETLQSAANKLASRALVMAPRWVRRLTLATAAKIQPIARRTVELRGRVLADLAAGLSGQLHWAGSSWPADPGDLRSPVYQSREVGRRYSGVVEDNRNDFAIWMRGLGPAPSATGKMNCWQAVMLTAYRAGLVSRRDLLRLHRRATEAAMRVRYAQGTGASPEAPEHLAAQGAYMGVLERALGLSHARVLWRREPRAGDIVFFGGTSHVAISLGTRNVRGEHEVMSLWMLPGKPDGSFKEGVQPTTIEAIHRSFTRVYPDYSLGDIRVASNPWSGL